MDYIQNLLARLEKVRKTHVKNGDESYIASCPCHKDNHPSLAITLKSDGVILLHCFSQQCTPHEITQAVGLEMSDLFPPKPQQHVTQNQRRGGLSFNPFQVLQILLFDLIQALAMMLSLQKGDSLTSQDVNQFSEIVCRLSDAIEAIKPQQMRGAR